MTKREESVRVVADKLAGMAIDMCRREQARDEDIERLRAMLLRCAGGGLGIRTDPYRLCAICRRSDGLALHAPDCELDAILRGESSPASLECGLWTVHRINSREEGWPDYRDSPPLSAEISKLGMGTLLIETSAPGEPCAYVLRYIGSFTEMQESLDEMHEGWDPWLAEWNRATARPKG